MSEELDDLVDKWHDSQSELSLSEYLGMTQLEYAVWVEFDIAPGESIPMEIFLALRSDAHRWANDADRYLTENRRYKEAVAEIRLMEDPDAESIRDCLDRNNV
jgi:hypothetical protein